MGVGKTGSPGKAVLSETKPQRIAESDAPRLWVGRAIFLPSPSPILWSLSILSQAFQYVDPPAAVSHVRKIITTKKINSFVLDFRPRKWNNHGK